MSSARFATRYSSWLFADRVGSCPSAAAVFALVFGTFGGILATLTHGAPLGPFFATYFANATTTEFAASLLKTTIFGAMIAIICCYKGLTAKGGPEGVGRAVNQAVVLSVILLALVNVGLTQAYVMLVPQKVA